MCNEPPQPQDECICSKSELVSKKNEKKEFILEPNNALTIGLTIMLPISWCWRFGSIFWMPPWKHN